VVFPRGEGDEGRSRLAVEIEIEGCGRLLPPLRSKLFACHVVGVWRFVQGGLLVMKKRVVSLPRLSHTADATAINGNGPRETPSHGAGWSGCYNNLFAVITPNTEDDG
jgi:hypothetical protein